MAFISVPNAGAIGVNKDLSQHELPIAAWTDCRNIRFLDGYANQTLGYGQVYGDPQVTPFHLAPALSAGQRFWLYAGLNKIYAVTSIDGTAVHSNITRQATTQQLTFSTGPLFGALGINNGTSTNLGTHAATQAFSGTYASLLNGLLSNGEDHRTAPNFSTSALLVGTFPANTSSVKTPNLLIKAVTADVDYAGTPNAWTSTILGGIPIFNAGNKIDPPQQWDLNAKDRMTMLQNWPTGMFCKSLRSFGVFLVALGLTKKGQEYPFMVKWSSATVPGAVPSTWDETDATSEAGEVDLAQGYDQIVDGLQLNNVFMIYKESSIHRMTYVGGQNVFSFEKVLGTSGALNRNCIAELDGYHVVLSNSDVIVHDGQTATSVLDKETRRYLFQNIDVDNGYKSFVYKNPFFNEVAICYPSIGATSCDSAMVWNYVDKTVSFRDLPNLNHAEYGPVDSGLQGSWDSDSAPWDSDLTAWNGPDFVPSNAHVIMASDSTKLYMLDASSSFDGVIPNAYLERRGLSFGTAQSIKTVRGIRPRITGNVGETVNIQIGGSNDPYADPVYGPVMAHVIGQTVDDQCFVSGRYIAVKLATGTAFQWRLDSYDLDVSERGMY